MNNLLVASIYAPTPRNSVWLRLQSSFLDQTTTDYKHAVYLCRVNRSLFKKTWIIGESRKTKGAAQSHSTNLSNLIRFFLTQDYAYYLILDSDAFPIKDGWLDILKGKMAQFKKGAAAVIRTENLTLSPHPCVYFMTNSYLKKHTPDFDIAPVRKFLGKGRDVGGNLLLKNTFPLLRTNYINYHPVYAGIYSNMFYHHGQGSRQGDMWSDSYYSGLELKTAEKSELFERLRDNPSQFISELTK